MSTLGTIYKSLSGLVGFTKGLDNLSGNIANMNTPGYKGRDAFFQEIADTEGKTSGVKAGEGSIRFLQGDLRSTGINTNLAIQGDGFFVLRDGTEYLYARAGNFSFDQDGVLVDRGTGRQVQSLSQNGALSDISLSTQTASASQATNTINFSGSLYPLTINGTVIPASGQISLNLFDSNGSVEAVNLRLTKLDSTALNFIPTPGDTIFWQVSIVPVGSSSGVVSSPLQNGDLDQVGNVIAFQASGAISNTYNQLTLNYTFGNAAAQNRSVALDFGGAGTFSGIVSDSNNSQSNVRVSSNDGRAIGYTTESSVSIDRAGNIKAVFTNGDEIVLGRVALAQFSANKSLIAAGDNYYRLDGSKTAIFGWGSDGSFGEVVAGSIEGSNVELSREFSEIIILQRGYQASSQVLNATNKMLEELYNSVRGG